MLKESGMGASPSMCKRTLKQGNRLKQAKYEVAHGAELRVRLSIGSYGPLTRHRQGERRKEGQIRSLCDCRSCRIRECPCLMSCKG